MEVFNFQTFCVFLSKTLREKKYYWVRNFSFSLFPIVSITLFLFLSSNMGDQASSGSHKLSNFNTEVCKFLLSYVDPKI